jgi:hypothetical protein
MSDQNLTPAELLNILAKALDAWARKKKGVASIAEDDFHVIELLSESPTGFRVICHWYGDKDQTDQPRAGIVTNELHVIISQNRGLTARAGSNKIVPRAGQQPLYVLVSQCRAAVRAIAWPEGVTDQLVTYKGCEPVVVDDMPLDAKRLKFELNTVISEAT